MNGDFDLTGVMEKVRRAMEHHDELQRATTSWMLEGGYRFVEVVEVDRAATSYTVRGTRPKPPVRIASIFGDLVHNLRSALDHLAQQLLLANGAVPANGVGGTSFPIAVARRREPPKIASTSGTISIEAARVLDAVQPYHWGDGAQGHPLARLSLLDNIDKHRLLHTAVLRAESRGAVFMSAAGDGMVMPHSNRYPIRIHGLESQRIVVSPEDVHDDPQVAGQWLVRLFLAEDLAGARLPLDALGAQLATHVAGEVIFRFLEVLGPRSAAELAEEIISEFSVEPGSFQDEVLKIAARGWGEPELARE